MHDVAQRRSAALTDAEVFVLAPAFVHMGGKGLQNVEDCRNDDKSKHEIETSEAETGW